MTSAASITRSGSPPTIVRVVAAGVWLLFLSGPSLELVHHAEGWRKYLGLGALALFICLYLWTFARFAGTRSSYPENPKTVVPQWLCIAGLLALVAALAPGARDESLTALVFVAAIVVAVLPIRQGLTAVAALFILTELLGRLVTGWSENGDGLAIILAAAATWAFRMALMRRQQLVLAERELGELALEEERSRIARDLHDILGHSLTVIAVKTELAGRLLDVDTERTRAELQDLERLTRDALADVRATALGVRGIALPGEIASARSALEAAGIDPALPTVADEIPSRWRELFAWTIRESVTNVIRHSHAKHCTITMCDRRLSITDDGDGPAYAATDGRGLSGLRQRAALVGATITTGSGPGGKGFNVSVEVPS
ncbi:sensor histidine kinase [Antricoccus suffuscus]|uniref:sensor histidine kinase n=1 Tax=Antricoccus suffuscus TaxID=1629062 RepID=UPI00192D3290|nr:histidine kinase [Antricoccus suffuscus]